MKKFLFIFFLFWLSSVSAQKQNNKIDSLHKSFNKDKSDTAKVKTLIELCKVYQSIQIDSALLYAKKALVISENIKYTKGIANCLNGIGYSYYIKGDLKLANQYLFKSYNIYKTLKFSSASLYNIFNIGTVYAQREKHDSAFYYYSLGYKLSLPFNNSNDIGDCLNNMGESSRRMAKYAQAVDYFYSAIKEFEKVDNLRGISSSNIGIGNLYFSQNKYKEASEFYLKTLAFLEKNQTYGLQVIYNNLGATHSMQSTLVTDTIEKNKLIEKSLEYFNKGLAVNIKLGNKSSMARSYGNIGAIYADNKDYVKAKECFLKGLQLSKESNNKLSEIKNTERIGEIFSLTGDTLNARIYLTEALNLALKLKIKDKILSVNEQLYKHYFRLKNYDLAFHYQSAFIANKDSLLNEQNQNKLSQLKTEFETEKKETQISLLAKDQIVKSLLINEQNNQLITKQIEAKQKENEIELLNKDKSLKEILLQQEIIQKEKKEQENQFLNVKNELSQETIKQQRFISYFIIGGFLIVSVLAFFIFNGLKKQRVANKIISLQKKEVEEQKHLIEEHQKETIDSINYAKRIQYALLANSDLLKQNLPEHFVLFNPKDIVSGDFYWATHHENKFYLAVCDSTGHGVPGAFMSLLNMGFLSEAIKEKGIYKPNEVLNYVRKRLIESIGNDGQQDGMDAILICIDNNMAVGAESRTITYSAANNEPILITEGKIIELPKDKMPVGKGEKTESFKLHTLEAKKGDVLYLYTDGYADQFGGPKGKKFMYKKLKELLISISQKQMHEQKQLLINNLNDWRGELEQVDDVCIIGIKI